MRSVAAVAAALLAALLVWSSVSWVPGLSLSFASLSGEPRPEAFVAYCFEGSRFNFVDSLSYWRPGGVVRTDGEGRFETPGFLQLHRPLDGGLEPYVEWVYVPALHHVFGPITRRSEGAEGLMEVDVARGIVRLADLGDDPDRWSQAMQQLEHAIHRSTRTGEACAPATPEVSDRLRAHLAGEFAAFMARHADSPRRLPETPYTSALPGDERAALERAFRESLEREPLWGQRMNRLFPELAAPGR